jgi:hypothetical protein
MCAAVKSRATTRRPGSNWTCNKPGQQAAVLEAKLEAARERADQAEALGAEVRAAAISRDAPGAKRPGSTTPSADAILSKKARLAASAARHVQTKLPFNTLLSH